LPSDTSFTFSLAIPASFIKPDLPTSTESAREEEEEEEAVGGAAEVAADAMEVEEGTGDEPRQSLDDIWTSLLPPPRFMPRQHPTWSAMPDAALQRDRLALVGGGVGPDGRELSEADTRFMTLKTSSARTTRTGAKYQVDRLPAPAAAKASTSAPKSILKRAPVQSLDEEPAPLPLPPPRTTTVTRIPRGGARVWNPLPGNVKAARKLMAKTAHAGRAPGAGPLVERELTILAALTAAQYDVEAALTMLSPQNVQKDLQDAFPSPLPGSNTPFASTAESRCRAWLRPHRVASTQCYADNYPIVEPAPADLWSSHTHQAFLSALRTHGADLRMVARSMDSGVDVVDVVDAYYRWRLSPAVLTLLGPFEGSEVKDRAEVGADVLEAAALSRSAASKAADTCDARDEPRRQAAWLPTVDDAKPIVLHTEPLVSFDNDAPSAFPKAIGFDEPGAQAGVEAQITRDFFDELREALLEAAQRRKNKAERRAAAAASSSSSSSAASKSLMRMGTNSTKAPEDGGVPSLIAPPPIRTAATNAADSMEIAAALQDGFYFTSSDEDAAALEYSSDEEEWRAAGRKRAAARAKAKHGAALKKRAKTASKSSTAGADGKKKASTSTSSKKKKAATSTASATSDAPPPASSRKSSTSSTKSSSSTSKSSKSTKSGSKASTKSSKSSKGKSKARATNEDAEVAAAIAAVEAAKAAEAAAAKKKAKKAQVTEEAPSTPTEKPAKSRAKRNYYVVPDNELPYLAHRPGGMDTPPPNPPGKELCIGDRVAAWYSIAGWCNATVIDQRLGRSIKEHEYLVRYDMDESEYWVSLGPTVRFIPEGASGWVLSPKDESGMFA
jgi:hypothetical protein